MTPNRCRLLFRRQIINTRELISIKWKKKNRKKKAAPTLPIGRRRLFCFPLKKKKRQIHQDNWTGHTVLNGVAPCFSLSCIWHSIVSLYLAPFFFPLSEWWRHLLTTKRRNLFHFFFSSQFTAELSKRNQRTGQTAWKWFRGRPSPQHNKKIEWKEENVFWERGMEMWTNWENAMTITTILLEKVVVLLFSWMRIRPPFHLTYI